MQCIQIFLLPDQNSLRRSLLLSWKCQDERLQVQRGWRWHSSIAENSNSIFFRSELQCLISYLFAELGSSSHCLLPKTVVCDNTTHCCCSVYQKFPFKKKKKTRFFPTGELPLWTRKSYGLWRPLGSSVMQQILGHAFGTRQEFPFTHETICKS